MSSDINLVALSRRNLPIAQMRPVYRVGDVEKRLDKLPQREHETLRATYERMLERGPERFQVKPGGLPADFKELSFRDRCLTDDLPFVPGFDSELHMHPISRTARTTRG